LRDNPSSIFTKVHRREGARAAKKKFARGLENA
jgi:hypothetical protein